MHKGSLPQPDDRENDGKRGLFYRGVGTEPWKVLWRPPGQKHWNAETSIRGIAAAQEIAKRLSDDGNEVHRYRI
jgi:hypothetical protein